MRLFYIITLLAFSISFAGLAWQKQAVVDAVENPGISFISCKKQVKINSGFGQADESLQKDIINNTVVKISHAAYILILFLFFLFSVYKRKESVIAIKRIKFNYWYLFKILYPKHVFW